MKMLTGSAVLVAAMLALPACGGSHAVTITDAAPGSVLHTTLPASLVRLIHSFRSDSGLTANRVEVYGPGSRRELVKASSGDLVQKLEAERKGFYVIVLHGHFVAGSHPQGTKAPRGTVETQVWSAAEGVTDTGISNRLPAALYRLNSPTLVRVSAPSPMQRGFTSIPNLRKISESRGLSICSGFKGTSVPAYCRPGGALHSTRGFEQVWEPKSGTRRSGEPSQVVIDVLRTPSAAVAKHYSVVYAHTAGYTALPGAAINNGLAARINSHANDGRTEFRFAWTSGRSMVELNIIGAGLTLREAQAVARRARPT